MEAFDIMMRRKWWCQFDGEKWVVYGYVDGRCGAILGDVRYGENSGLFVGDDPHSPLITADKWYTRDIEGKQDAKS